MQLPVGLCDRGRIHQHPLLRGTTAGGDALTPEGDSETGDNAGDGSGRDGDEGGHGSLVVDEAPSGDAEDCRWLSRWLRTTVDAGTKGAVDRWW